MAHPERRQEARALVSEGAPESLLQTQMAGYPTRGLTPLYTRREDQGDLLVDFNDAGSDFEESERDINRGGSHSDREDYHPSLAEAKARFPSNDDQTAKISPHASVAKPGGPQRVRCLLPPRVRDVRDALAAEDPPLDLELPLSHPVRESILGLEPSQAPPRQRLRLVKQVSTVLARFEEWPLENVSLKRITENGVATFQLQFNWNLCTKGHAGSFDQNRGDTPTTKVKDKPKRTSLKRSSFTPEEDAYIIKLKEGSEKLAWSEIHQRFSDRHQRRSIGTLQVYYSTKLKNRESA
ncbi:Fc.00g056140.m01.CDS01 [Cosmosporella sp. VM-42]